MGRGGPPVWLHLRGWDEGPGIHTGEIGRARRGLRTTRVVRHGARYAHSGRGAGAIGQLPRDYDQHGVATAIGECCYS